jgi:stringent starvation protein B
MTSSKPYILRALHEWIEDNGQTPLILVNTRYPGVDIPAGIDSDGKVVLNISSSATDGLLMDSHGVGFSARFSGKSAPVFVPMGAVLAIYSRDSGQGMMFEENDSPPPDHPPEKPHKGKPTLRVVK